MSSNAIAKNVIPAAEIPVSVLRTLGLAKKTEDLSTANIKTLYQENETVACTKHNINIPVPKAKCLGTNCGMNATANTAALTFVRFVNNPNW